MQVYNKQKFDAQVLIALTEKEAISQAGHFVRYSRLTTVACQNGCHLVSVCFIINPGNFLYIQ